MRTFGLHLEKSQGEKRERSDQGDRMRTRRRLGERIETDEDWARREERWRERGREEKTVSNGYKLEVKGIWQPCIAYEMILTFYYCKVSFLKRNFKCYPAVREHKNL